MRRVFSILLKTIGIFIGMLAVYVIAALLLPKIVVHSDFEESVDGLELFILTNGVHTDLVIPYSNEWKDWSKFVNASNTEVDEKQIKYVSFGWGDKGFYLDTKTWDDLKFKTAFKALFHLSSSAMHVTYYKEMYENGTCRKVRISKEAYNKLVSFINKGFDIDSSGNPIIIKGASYDDNDSFYEAKGSYSLFYTCNSWANEGLKNAGMKSCLWTVFDKGIFDIYKK